MGNCVSHEHHGARTAAHPSARGDRPRCPISRGFRLSFSPQRPLPSIVEYRDGAAPRNDYPSRIVSPPCSGACCAAHMVSVGAPQADGRWVFQYRRCECCGFTVRRVVRELFDEAERVKLRLALAHAFVREAGEAA